MEQPQVDDVRSHKENLNFLKIRSYIGHIPWPQTVRLKIKQKENHKNLTT